MQLLNEGRESKLIPVSDAWYIWQANKATEVPLSKTSVRGGVNSLLLLEPVDPITTKVHGDSFLYDRHHFRKSLTAARNRRVALDVQFYCFPRKYYDAGVDRK